MSIFIKDKIGQWGSSIPFINRCTVHLKQAYYLKCREYFVSCFFIFIWISGYAIVKDGSTWIMYKDIAKPLISPHFLNLIYYCPYQISGAKVVVHQPHPGSSERIIVISGSPDETQAAQSLLQSFILSGSWHIPFFWHRFYVLFVDCIVFCSPPPSLIM